MQIGQILKNYTNKIQNTKTKTKTPTLQKIKNTAGTIMNKTTRVWCLPWNLRGLGRSCDKEVFLQTASLQTPSQASAPFPAHKHRTYRACVDVLSHGEAPTLRSSLTRCWENAVGESHWHSKRFLYPLIGLWGHKRWHSYKGAVWCVCVWGG